MIMIIRIGADNKFYHNHLNYLRSIIMKWNADDYDN
jgi:hypothetical protein